MNRIAVASDSLLQGDSHLSWTHTCDYNEETFDELLEKWDSSNADIDPDFDINTITHFHILTEEQWEDVIDRHTKKKEKIISDHEANIDHYNKRRLKDPTADKPKALKKGKYKTHEENAIGKEVITDVSLFMVKRPK